MQRQFKMERYETLDEANARVTELGDQFYVFKGNYVSDPYYVEMLPQVGEPVSYGFNGDYYPDGTIVKVSRTGSKVETSTGNTFYRKKSRLSCWVRAGGTFFLIFGHHDERNPHF